MIEKTRYKKIIISCLITTLLLSSIPTLVGAEPSITVTGRLMVHHRGDSSEPLIPVPNARVEIYDQEIIEYPIVGWEPLPWLDTYLGTVYTNSEGYFSFTINNNDGSTVIGDEKGRDIYLKIIASNRAAEVRNNPGWLAGSVFEFKTETKKNMANGEIWNLGNVEPSGSELQLAFDILATAEKAWKHIKEETGVELSKIKIFYNDAFKGEVSYHLKDMGNYLDIIPLTDLTGYFPEVLLTFLQGMRDIWDSASPIQKGMVRDLAGIHLTSNDCQNSDRFYEVIFHEYGHYVMEKLFELGPPFTVTGTHYIDDEHNINHAWVEGWAEFYSCVARKYYNIDKALELGNFQIETGLYEPTETKQWDSVEGNIASVLWDIIDENNEARDDLTISFGEMVRIIKNYDTNPTGFWPFYQDHAWNIYGVFEAFRHSLDPEAVSKLWILLQKHGITIPDTTPPTNPTSYISSHNSIIGTNDLTIEVDLHGAYDDVSGLNYWYYFHPSADYTLNLEELEVSGGFSSTLYDRGWKQTNSGPHIESPALTYDIPIWHLYILTIDNAGNTASNIYHAGPFLLSEHPPLLLHGAITNYLGSIILGAQSGVEVNAPPTYEGKTYTPPFLKIGDLQEEETLAFSTVINFINRPEGYYEIKVYEEGQTDEAAYLYPLLLDKTPPTINLHIGQPQWTGDYISSGTPLSITATDDNAGVKTIEYSLDGTNWHPYTAPFYILGKPEGHHTIHYRATDYVGNIASDIATVILDNSPANVNIEVGNPQVVSDRIYITEATTISITASDDGCGLNTVEYRTNTGDEWIEYTDPFTIIGEDGEYTLSYRELDNLGNLKENQLTLVNDNTGPQIQKTQSLTSLALQDTIDFWVYAQDQTGINHVKLSIRNANAPEQPIGFENIALAYNSEKWILSFNTIQLPDGHYLIRYTATDGLGNQEVFDESLSIRNWAATELLPGSQTNKAGRTMPIKFSLTVKADIDPAQPFVYNEHLTIKIFQTNQPGTTLQESTFGTQSKDYRIDQTDKLYITNFSTLRTPTHYTVEIYRETLLIASFTFRTIK